jgi:hypothetical protein
VAKSGGNPETHCLKDPPLYAIIFSDTLSVFLPAGKNNPGYPAGIIIDFLLNVPYCISMKTILSERRKANGFTGI